MIRSRHGGLWLLVVVALIAGLVWYAQSRRTSTPQNVGRSAPADTALTFEALVDSAAHLVTRFRLEADTIPRDDHTRFLQAAIDHLKRVTYLYYDWVSEPGAAVPSGERITREYLLPAVVSVLEARPEIGAAHAGLRSDAVVRLYFLSHRMLLVHGVIHSSSGMGRFPSLELLPIVKETPLDREVWGRWIDAVGFVVRDPN